MYIENNCAEEHKSFTCCACLYDFEDGDKIELSCHHVFNNDCLKSWFNECLRFNTHPNCPFCATKVDSNDVKIFLEDENLDFSHLPFSNNGLKVNNNLLYIVEDAKIVNILGINKNGYYSNIYSFSLNPESHIPTGTYNVSRINHAFLNLELHQPSGWTNFS